MKKPRDCRQVFNYGLKVLRGWKKLQLFPRGLLKTDLIKVNGIGMKPGSVCQLSSSVCWVGNEREPHPHIIPFCIYLYQDEHIPNLLKSILKSV